MDFLLTVEGQLLAAAILQVLLIVLLTIRHLQQRRAEKEEAAREEAAGKAAVAQAPAAAAPPPAAPRPPEPTGFRAALARSRESLRVRLDAVFGSRDLEHFFPALEEVMVGADVGIRTTGRLLEGVRRRVGRSDGFDETRVRRALCEAIEEVLGDSPDPGRGAKPWVILFAGVNGVGKTTTIGKLGARFRAEGRKVLFVAADTFRAAAIDQLGVWAERIGAELVRHQSGADPGAVAFDGVKAAVARDVDVVLVDTAGRLHTRENLMEELRKVARVIDKALPGAPHEVLLVLDATTGQNALSQARVFSEAIGVTGIVLTKLDGTAKGGAALAVRDELGVPIRWVGVGERVEDLRPFSAAEFARALVGDGDASAA